MEKPAPAQHHIADLIARRWSPRAFEERPLEPEKFKSLFEAARWAPSSNNEQPWRFLAATKDHRADYDRLLGCLSEGNLKWAFRAPVLILSVASLLLRTMEHQTGMPCMTPAWPSRTLFSKRPPWDCRRIRWPGTMWKKPGGNVKFRRVSSR